MKITINREDGVVGVDGAFRRVDLSGLPVGICVIQFDTIKNVGHIEYSRDITTEANVRDLEAERAAEEAAAGDPKAIAALRPVSKRVLVPRANETLADAAPLQRYLEAWAAAAPAAPPPKPTAEELELATKRAAALRALDELRLAEAIADPLAPKAVKDYGAALARAL